MNTFEMEIPIKTNIYHTVMLLKQYINDTKAPCKYIGQRKPKFIST